MIQSQIKPSDVESSVQLAQPCSNDEPTSVTVIMSSDSDGDNNFSDIQLTSDIYGQSVQVLNDSNLDIFDNCSPQDNASSNLDQGPDQPASYTNLSTLYVNKPVIRGDRYVPPDNPPV